MSRIRPIPLIRTIARIFPGLLQPLDAMPADLRAHIRYPEGLFRVQAAMYAVYHMRDTQVFYNKEDLWSIPLGARGRAGSARWSPTTSSCGCPANRRRSSFS